MESYGVESQHDLVGGIETTRTRIGPGAMAVLFGSAFAAIADLAWITASATTSPWFTPAVSSQTYSTTLVAASIGAFILASLADSRAGRPIVRRDRSGSHDGDGGDRMSIESNQERAYGTRDPLKAIENRIDELWSLEGPQLLEMREDKAIVREVVFSPRSTGSPRREAPSTSAIGPEIQILKGRVWKTVSGPLGMFLVFAAMSGAMLPGTGGFAVNHFALNTTLVLFLAYGWPFLVVWTVVAIAMLDPWPDDRARRRTARKD